MSTNGTEMPAFSPSGVPQSLQTMSFEVNERAVTWDEFVLQSQNESRRSENGIWQSAGCSFTGYASHPRIRRRIENIVTVVVPGALACMGGLMSGYFSTLVTGPASSALSFFGSLVGGGANSLSTRWSYNSGDPEMFLSM